MLPTKEEELKANVRVLEGALAHMGAKYKELEDELKEERAMAKAHRQRDDTMMSSLEECHDHFQKELCPECQYNGTALCCETTCSTKSYLKMMRGIFIR